MSHLNFRNVDEVRACCEQHDMKLVVYEQSVLDVSDFKHPGPQSTITSSIGQDITQAFDARGHSHFAREMCDRLTVGQVGRSSQPGQLFEKSCGNMAAEERDIHKRLDDMIDIKKPLLPQVKKLSNKEFIAFVRRPRYIEHIDGIILFEDEQVDEASKRPLRHNIEVSVPTTLLCLLVSFAYSESTSDFMLNFVLFFLFIGLGVVWVLVEYVFHRLLLHPELHLDAEKPADGDRNAKMFEQHLHHHVFMNQWYRTTINRGAYLFYGPPIFISLSCLLSLPRALLTMGGIIIGSLLYDAMHLAFHHGPDIKFGWFQKMKARHMRHHFRDHSREFAVTSPLFDIAFGSDTRPQSVKLE